MLDIMWSVAEETQGICEACVCLCVCECECVGLLTRETSFK
jgi:hypothetical protein